MVTQETMMPTPEASLATLGLPFTGDGANGRDLAIQPEFLPAPVDVVQTEQGRLRTAWAAGKNALKAAVIMTELLPVTNEGARYGAFAYGLTVTQNPLIGAAVLGGTTLLIEGGSALAASKWVADDKIKDVIDRTDNRLANTRFAFLSPKRYIPENLRVSPAVEAGLGMTLGTLAVLEAKQREDPSRTTTQNLRRGLFTAGWLSAVFAAEGAMLAEGIDNPTNPSSVGIALLGLAGLAAFGRWAKRRIQTRINGRAGV
jgi:MYXO-CTERM domain-containing protein